MTIPTPTSRWWTTAELQKALRLSNNALSDLRSDGYLKPGDHWIRKGVGNRAPILWDATAVEGVLRDLARREKETYAGS